MILLCSEKDFIYSSASTGSDVVMTSNCIYDLISFSSALLKTKMAFREKINSFRMFPDLHFKAKRL